jgi:hypothetical protein
MFAGTGVTHVRTRLVVTVAALIAIAALLPACSSSSSKGSAPAASTTSASSVTTSPPAGTATALTCTALAGTLTLSPPVSPTASVAHTLTAKGTISGCTGTPGITSGEFTLSAGATDKLNCAQVLTYSKPGTATVSVKWNNGSTSTGSKLALTYATVASTTITGKFTGGTAFVGKTTTSTTANSPDGGGCLTGGASLSTATLSLAPDTKYTIG